MTIATTDGARYRNSFLAILWPTASSDRSGPNSQDVEMFMDYRLTSFIFAPEFYL